MNNKEKRTFSIYNFGCKVNQEEGGELAALFVASGWIEATAGDSIDLIVINTCTVTQVADKKARNLIRRLHREHPQAVIAVCGCYAQRAAAEIEELAGVSIIAGVDERRLLPELVGQYMTKQSSCLTVVSDISAAREFHHIAQDSLQTRARAYLKIEDGCDQFCTYCIIPHVRGPVRSLPVEQAVSQAERLLAVGHAEIVLSGIHIGAYGSDFDEPDALITLIKRIVALPGLLRLRLGSIEPQQFSEQLLTLIGEEPKICRHLHIPLQSGCDKTLYAMGRHYDTEFYHTLLIRLRELGGDIAFTSDVMVGFPGETEEDFQQSLEFCQECGFSHLHIFPYSRRKGTPAAEFPGQIQQMIKAERAARMAQMAEQTARAYAERYIGAEMTLLVEERVEIEGVSYLRGHSGNYLTLLLKDSQISQCIRQVRGKLLSKHGIVVEQVL